MAIKNYKQASELNTENSEYYFRMGYCFQALDQYDDSLSTYMEYIKQFGEDSSVYNNMALIYRDYILDYEKALEYYDKAIERNPEEALTYANKAELFYYQLNDLNNYLIFQDIAIEKSKNDPDQYNFISAKANILFENRNFEDSKIETYKLIDLNRDDPDGFYKLAMIYFEEKDYYRSLNEISLSIEKLKNNPNGFFINDVNNEDLIDLSDLYFFRAEIYSKLNVSNLSCEDYNSYLSLRENSDAEKNIKSEESLSLNCNN